MTRWLRGAVFDLWLYASMLVMGVLLAPAAIYSRGGAVWAMRLYCRQALWMLERICGLRVEVRGDVPQGAALVAAKHQSFLDILVLMRTLPNPRFVMKRSLIWAPVLGLYAMRIGSVAVDRGAGAKALRKMRAAMAQDAEEGAQTVIFPQGTRLKPGAQARYMPGVAALYRDMGAECAPVAVNAGVYWPRASVARRPGVAVVAFLKPIPPGMARKPFMELLEERIEEASAALL